MDKYQQWAEQFFDREIVLETVQNFARHPKPILYGVLLAAVLAWLVVSAFQKFKQPTTGRANTPDLEKPAARTPSKFKAPERPPGGTRLASSWKFVLLTWMASMGSNRL